jgi:hypothetical protein
MSIINQEPVCCGEERNVFWKLISPSTALSGLYRHSPFQYPLANVGQAPPLHARAKLIVCEATKSSFETLIVVLSFLYFPALQRAHKCGFASKFAEHEHSIGPVRPAAPNELAVHALHVVYLL